MKKLGFTLSALALALSGCGDKNSIPAVNAGVDITIEERNIVTFNATATDPDGPVTILWEQIAGTDVDIEGANTVNASFRAPSTTEDETLEFRLTVTDSDGAVVTDEISVFVVDRNGSSQGIDDDIDDRRNLANEYRIEESDFVDNREVRTFDGSLNNEANPTWGQSFSHLERFGDADYEDGISTLAGPDRPSARVVSNNIHGQTTGETIPNTFGTTDFLWQWGQFIDHDIGVTDGLEEAADIEVPTGDMYFDPDSTGTAVISFSRAIFDHDTGTDVNNPREQENELTAWIDGSMVYGSDSDRAAALRVGTDSPFLATSDGNLLPFNTSGQTNANAFGVADEELFLGGDIRVNEQVGLAVMHTLWVREHNRIAAILQENSPNASAEELFQAARRLVIAKIQFITYEQFLPALIGPDAISDYDGYDATVNPGLFNEFSVATFRFGHSLVNNALLRLDDEGNTIDEGNLELRDAFFTAPSILTEEDSLDPILRGQAGQLSQKLDVLVSSDLRNFLFGAPGEGGLDLVSLNIQRGRDHGVPSYNDMREVFNLGRKTSFAEITSDADLQAALEATYSSVDDIDLFTGGLAEDPLTDLGSQLGELFRAIHIVQFEALRDGDRFWYERDLTDEELEFVQGASLGGIIRANTSIGDELQDDVFFIDSE